MDDKMMEKIRFQFPSVTDEDIRAVLDEYEKLSPLYTSKRKRSIMNKKDRDVVCEIWLEVFGVQSGVGRNCPNGAYEFAKKLLAAKDKEIADLYTMCLTQARTIKEYQDAGKNSRSRARKAG